MLNRRQFLASIVGTFAAISARSEGASRRILLRSSWQTANIGDIAHTPGMLALLEKHCPADSVTLWPKGLNAEVEKLLLDRFPRLSIARTGAEQEAALSECHFFLHGSGPGLVGAAEARRAQQAGKPYGFGGITLSDDELRNHRELLAGAKFVFTRDTDSLRALQAAGIQGPEAAFGPDATFAFDLRDETAADKLLQQHGLKAGEFLCAVPRLRWTPYWEINPSTTKPNPARSAVNEAFADRDHSRMREAIVAWVRELGRRVLLAPEMTYAVPRLRPLLYDPLPEDVKQSVAVLDRYWLTAEAASVYARAAAVISFEMHSPILAVSGGTPAIYLRQPTDTRKGQMWRDVGLERWIFEIDEVGGKRVADRLLELGRDLPAARKKAEEALAYARERMAGMMAAIP